MKNIFIAAALLISTAVFAQEVRLDDQKDLKVNTSNMSAKGSGWKMDKALFIKSDVYVEFIFPKVYSITRIAIGLEKYSFTRTGLDKKEFPGLFNFEILCKDPAFKEMKTVRVYNENSSYEINVKDKFKSDTIRIKLNKVFEGSNYCYWGGIAKIQIFGYEGEEPKKQKKKKEDISSAEEAKEAFREGLITSPEYIELLKTYK